MKELSYVGLLFRRIVVTSGYTYGKRIRVSTTHLITKFSDDYENKRKRVYRRNNKGYWYYDYEIETDRRTELWNALNWLETNGFIVIKRNATVILSRLSTGKDDFITLTEKGLAVAPKYLAMKDPFAKGKATHQ